MQGKRGVSVAAVQPQRAPSKRKQDTARNQTVARNNSKDEVDMNRVKIGNQGDRFPSPGRRGEPFGVEKPDRQMAQTGDGRQSGQGSQGQSMRAGF